MSGGPFDGTRVVSEGVEDGIEWATCTAPVYGGVNGYVLVPEGHPWHGLGYDDIPADVHGGLTFAEGSGWIGFDTLHYRDWWPGMAEEPFPALEPHPDAIMWTQAMVEAETKRLARAVAGAAS